MEILKHIEKEVLERLFTLLIKPPFHVYIEPTNACNLKCPLCPTSSSRQPKKFMKLHEFEEIVNKLKPHIRIITCHLFGEPLLNKEFFKMVKYAYENGIKTDVETNGTLLHNFSLDELFESGISKVTFAVDGATKETYERYRIGGNFDQVIKNIKNLCIEKRKRGLAKPLINLQFVLMKHNRSERMEIQRLAKELGVDSLIIKKGHLIGTPDLTGEEREQKIKQFFLYDLRPINPCTTRGFCLGWLNKCAIASNGDIILCCEDFEHKYVVGNVFEESPKEIFKDKKYKLLKRKAFKRELSICHQCDASLFPKPNTLCQWFKLFYFFLKNQASYELIKGWLRK